MSRQFATIYDIFCPVPFLPSPFGFRRFYFMFAALQQQYEPFLPQDLQLREGNPFKQCLKVWLNHIRGFYMGGWIRGGLDLQNWGAPFLPAN